MCTAREEDKRHFVSLRQLVKIEIIFISQIDLCSWSTWMIINIYHYLDVKRYSMVHNHTVNHGAQRSKNIQDGMQNHGLHGMKFTNSNDSLWGYLLRVWVSSKSFISSTFENFLGLFSRLILFSGQSYIWNINCMLFRTDKSFNSKPIFFLLNDPESKNPIVTSCPSAS